ncbi:hypothetical protein [Erwinia sp. PsM31]|uniref:hypothetical protein n=1 Tax=Erwinia sp. PsM31 TaxID=3030535 RepID=UPI00263AB27B|nr:hypothetical protein [Erwinia sp. PsM31]MDN4628104.1 hypothetical protein [Erwinia sp. PsM31]
MRYGTGHMLQMNLKHNGKLQEIAGVNPETGRSQSVLHQETHYDLTGRIVMWLNGFSGRNIVVV